MIGYHRSRWGCEACGTANATDARNAVTDNSAVGRTVGLLLGLGGLVVGVAAVYLGAGRKTLVSALKDKDGRIPRQARDLTQSLREQLPFAATLGKVILGYCQCVAVLRRFERVVWPTAFVSFLDMMDVFDLNLIELVPAECAVGSRLGFFVELAATLLLPPIGVGAVLLLACIVGAAGAGEEGSVNEEARSPSNTQQRTTRLKATLALHRVWTLSTWVLLLLYPSLCRKTLATFDCIPYGERWLLRSDSAIECYVGRWTAWSLAAALGVVVYGFGLPLAAYLAVRRYRVPSSEQYRQVGRAATEKRVALLLSSYRDECWYMEVVDLLRKLSLTGGILLVGPGKRLQLWVGSLVNVGFLLVHVTLKPYREATSQLLQTAAHLQLLFCYMTSILFYDDGDEVLELTGEQDLYGMMLILANAVTFVLLLLFFTRFAARSLAESKISDPRWDRKGFERWAKEGRVAFVKLDFLRELSERKLPIRDFQYRSVVQTPGAAYVGPPPTHAQIIAVVDGTHARSESAQANQQHLEETLRALLKLLEEFDGEFDGDDCVYWPYMSLIQQTDNKKAHELAVHGELRIHTYYRVKVAVFPGSVQASHGPLFPQGKSMAALVLSTFCQRIMNPVDSGVQKAVDPKRLGDLKSMFKECTFNSDSEREDFEVRVHETLKKIAKIKDDKHGFDEICKEVQLRWLKISYLKKLAKDGGMLPRQQDLKHGGYHIGTPPAGGRKFSLSHGWASQIHPSPDGGKIKRLLEVLARYGADDERDGVFIEWVKSAVEPRHSDFLTPWVTRAVEA